MMSYTELPVVSTRLESMAANDNISNLNHLRNGTLVSPIVTNYYYGDSNWIFNSHDIPILIGAAAGAIGLIIIFLVAALIWQCCQFGIQREKSSYSLNSDSEKNSSCGRDSNMFMNNSDSLIIISEKGVFNDNVDPNIRRSISAPLTRENANNQNNTQAVIKPQTLKRTNRALNSAFGCHNETYMINIADQMAVNNDYSSVMDLCANQCVDQHHRSYVYVSDNHNQSDLTLLKSRSLPWNQSNKRRNADNLDNVDIGELNAKVNFSKKRKNRMRNDSAAAIALNRSGTNPSNHSHKDTDTLVDNEAVVVYDERTAL